MIFKPYYYYFHFLKCFYFCVTEIFLFISYFDRNDDDATTETASTTTAKTTINKKRERKKNYNIS